MISPSRQKNALRKENFGYRIGDKFARSALIDSFDPRYMQKVCINIFFATIGKITPQVLTKCFEWVCVFRSILYFFVFNLVQNEGDIYDLLGAVRSVYR